MVPFGYRRAFCGRAKISFKGAPARGLGVGCCAIQTLECDLSTAISGAYQEDGPSEAAKVQ
jgi:hypothetical protein